MKTIKIANQANGRLSFKTAALFSAAVLIIGSLLQITAPYSQGISLIWDTIFHFDSANYQHLITHLTYLPRLAVAVICGFALAVAGCVMQFVLRNPIASPTTLGVAAGAELGMVLGILLIPANLVIPGFVPAFIGGCLATGLVFVLSSARGFSPLHMVLAGMVVSLFLGSLNTMLLMLHEQRLTSIFVWGAGVLNQNDWSSTQMLLPLVLLPTSLLLVLQRPLSALQFGDNVATSLGVNIKQIKLLCLSLAIFITAAVVSEVGLIGFVGIVAPAIARMLGVRALAKQILASGVIGSSILLIVDLVIQPFSGVGGELLPTGAMTALIGAPFLLWLLQRTKLQSDLKARSEHVEHYKLVSTRNILVTLTVALIAVSLFAIMVGKNQLGWSLGFNQAMFELRAPRVLVALISGIGLAFAGTIIQRISNNPMASPEVLGISSGAALALVLGTLFGIAVGREQQMLLGTLGAVSVTAVVWLMGRKHNFAPTQTLLTGIALSAGLDALLRIAMSSGHDNASALLTWLSGSTYLVAHNDVVLLTIGVTFVGAIALSLNRWIELIGLGEVTANSIGMNATVVRLVLLLLVAALTTLCTIVIGPLSFIGLLAPHMARSLHQYRATPQMLTAALLGATIMVLADWIGRTLWFPWQFPAGLLASLIGGGYFLYLMRR
ncbi:Fe(3+)-hydroxamate ABC transporter permease FhuB [Vibrio europaeus]|uniref:Fe(3+)-hydroxamate ABC transporter permease FhuB n=1 Tax=Vibrio europaeus TaxID=300876 RepID=A0A178J6Y4_9VIBR|nr:Fe(3+)-hydroxamate ABC transporter permease FhuB [Vibrio europaeus]MDC5705855.1 Fe(3+)-hydroxamate ABC transporter permease FhuB [Vibrio europaeus]MDC5709265.1 Fe(3+)-hydroxamate ABC transporter permease FhuB [Vibrio europaeus]MDC5713664.1 Fe(3+)-hydroxamate ABC transporter permease FhuB [Vibrio europaeus]MDC5720384.1 Fe(3+)-hydroxamate ABC transporter permease FhuB [Vibrio europaeus]MDC5723729.1 Fe(3+)-hydroxamate ABC transporter permease FhuB [Vibrio europaeus]